MALVELLWSLHSATHTMKMIIASFQDEDIQEDECKLLNRHVAPGDELGLLLLLLLDYSYKY